MGESLEEKTVPQMVNDWWESEDLASIHSFEADTVRTTAKLVHNIVDCRLLTDIVSGEIGVSMQDGHIGLWKKLPKHLLRWYCIGMMRKHKKTSRVDKVEILGDHVVDLTNGDIASVNGGKGGRVEGGVFLRLHQSNEAYLHVLLNGCPGRKNRKPVFVRVHHLITYSMDQDGHMFDVAHRFSAYRGYCHKRLGHIRPTCNLDQDAQDTVGGACKTDVDHWLGYGFNCIYALWRCHHSVNRWFHHIRENEAKWMAPHVPDEKYAEERKDRQFPSWYDNLVPTLTELKRAATGAEGSDTETDDED
jgi:hypothetical protein